MSSGFESLRGKSYRHDVSDNENKTPPVPLDLWLAASDKVTGVSRHGLCDASTLTFFPAGAPRRFFLFFSSFPSIDA